ncbi:hypothetical protein [Streptomyces sp. NBC_01618]|uniref:hypothetical protein n=1 Tax=Streptomyces sp. NBC_01618 TaxID=2975900 RepID=UPI0038656F4D|nr:hypothetical protein OH735_08460 [Streptomyces sp. NBC_01618]
MPTHVVTCRVPPYVHDQLRDLAERRGQTLAATTTGILAAALDDPTATGSAQDGAIVTAVRTVLAEVDDPKALMHRELAVVLARAVERRSPGYIAAASSLRTSVEAALSAQRCADSPGDDSMSALLDGLGLL